MSADDVLGTHLGKMYRFQAILLLRLSLVMLDERLEILWKLCQTDVTISIL